jgi:hypothetical protein
MPAAPAPLAENLPFAFRGERADPRAVIDAARARRWLSARNPTGVSNADVLRQTVGVAATGRRRLRWLVDFSLPDAGERKELYVAPHAAIAEFQLTANPDRELRNAVARIDRYLAAPADGAREFDWFDSELLPDDSLVVWARDDDFSEAVLASRAFGAWCEHCGDLLAALRSFPFPWPPAKPLSSLTRAQEDLRFALSRAARGGDAGALESALAEAYGWPPSLDGGELLARLLALHATRAR